jgi:hypothetical protein
MVPSGFEHNRDELNFWHPSEVHFPSFTEMVTREFSSITI